MKIPNSRFLIPTFISSGSFVCLLVLMLLTNPIADISYAILFFGLLLVLLLGLGHLLAIFITGQVSGRTKTRILVISFLLVIVLMLRSLGSLNWVDLVVALLLASGLLFYSSRR